MSGAADRERVDEPRLAALEAAFESAPVGMMALSRGGRLLALNRRFSEIWGFADGTLDVGADLSEVVTRISPWLADPTTFEAELLYSQSSRTGAGALGAVQDQTFDLADGRTLVCRSAPALDSSGEAVGRVWFFSDDAALLASEIEKADLVENLQASLRAQAFLLHAAGALAGTSGYVETVERLADVAVPILGDIFLIDVLDYKGRPLRVIARNADPALQEATDRLLLEFGPEPDGPDASVQVIATGRGEMVCRHDRRDTPICESGRRALRTAERARFHLLHVHSSADRRERLRRGDACVSRLGPSLRHGRSGAG